MEEEERICPDKGVESNDDVSLNIFHEESMLDKLRSCSTIPKNISEFQDFVRKLTKGTISDPVIQEVWEQIHNPELNIEDRILIRNAMSKVQCVASKKNIKSRKRHTKYSFLCELKNSKEKDNKAYYSDDYIRIYKEIFPNESLKTNEQNFPLSTESNAVKFSELFEQNTKQNREECLSTYKNSKPDKLFYKANKSHDRISESNKSKINNNNNKKNAENTNISSPDTSGSSIWKENVSLSPSIANSITHLNDGIETNISGNVMSCEKEEMEKQEEKEDESSSDCEVIQVVSLNKSKSNIRDDYSDSETNNTEIESSDSDSSIEILETSISNEVQENRKIVCPVHGNENVFKTQNSPEPPINNENHIDISEQKNSDSVVADKKCKNQKGKTKRNVKYNTLRTEVKCLKSLLINLLLSLRNNSNTDCKEVVNNEAQVSSADINVKLPVNTEKTKIQNCISEEKSNLTTENITLKTAAMRKQKMSGFNVMEKDKMNEGRKKMKRQETKKDSEQLQGSSHHKESGYRKRKKFPWREVITCTLKSKPGRQMHVEKLQRLVIAKYYVNRGNVSRNTKAKFFRYLLSTPGVAVDGEIAKFSYKQHIQMLKETKEFVMKTTKTTKEYTIS